MYILYRVTEKNQKQNDRFETSSIPLFYIYMRSCK